MVDIREVRRASRKHHSARNLGGELRSLQLSLNKSGNILQSFLDNLGNIALQNLLFGVTCHLHRYGCVARNAIGNCRAPTTLQQIDILLRNLQEVLQIIVYTRCSDWQRREVPQLALSHNRNIGQIATDIDNRHARLHLVGCEHQLGQKRRAYTQARHLYLGLIECSIESVNLVFARQYEEICSREFATKCTQWVTHTLVVVDSVAERDALYYLVATTRHNHLDTGIQLSQLVLGYGACLLVYLDIVLVTHAIDRTARNAHIRRIEAHLQFALQCRFCLVDGISELDVVDDIAILDTAILYRFDIDTKHRDFAILLANSHRHNDIR